MTESRSVDGSVLTFETEGKTPAGGRLWRGCGTVLGLDYSGNRAIFQRTVPRNHGKLPNIASTGNAFLAGVQCSIYPVQVTNGSGSLCLDVKDDIILRQEIHMSNAGARTDYLKEITSIDFSKPGPAETLQPPAGMQLLTPPSGSDRNCAK